MASVFLISATRALISFASPAPSTMTVYPAATFYFRVSGVSMVDDDFDEGDIIVVDRSLEPDDGRVAVCFIDGEFTLKRIRRDKDCIWLVPANKRFAPIRVTADNEFAVWGVVTYVIKKV